jgi:hypothetical protein
LLKLTGNPIVLSSLETPTVSLSTEPDNEQRTRTGDRMRVAAVTGR